MRGWQYIVLLLILAMSAPAGAQHASIKADTNQIVIGEQITLSLSVQYRVDEGDVVVNWPALKDTISAHIEIVELSNIDTVMVDKENDPYLFAQQREVIVTSFDSGYFPIPPFAFQINNDSVFTDALLITVNTVQIDTTQAIKDIKEIYEVPFSFADWFKENWGWFAGGAGVLVALWLLLVYLRKRKQKPVVEVKEEPKIPAHEIAIEQLEKLRKQKLWQQGKLKAYYVALTEILRIYIEERFKVHALEQTSEELLLNLRFADIDEASKMKLRQILMLSDLVKFAKEQPIAHENEQSIEFAISFVVNTKKELEEVAPITEEES